jgi:RNA-directed DNA polymerase
LSICTDGCTVDLVVGFQYRTDAERFLQEFRERLAKFGLELHADKTRLIEFGRFAARDRKYRGEGCDGIVSSLS